MRALFLGLAEGSWITFGLLIVIRGYGADDVAGGSEFIKGLIPAAGFIGLLLNTISLWVARATRLRVTKVISLYLVSASILLIASALVDDLLTFTALFVIGNVIYAQPTPLVIHTYAHNYTPQERGQKVSTVMVMVAAGTGIFSFLGGKLLDWDFSWYPVILFAMAFGCLVNAGILLKIPSTPLASEQTTNPLKNLRLAWDDKLFGWLLASWMMIGIANLMTMPIRVEILANPDYGIDATNEQVALANVIIPAIARIISGKFWGALFDRINFIVWRICVNSCFVVGMLLYFYGDSLTIIYTGAAFIGFGMGGGMIGWTLWVTKIAPPEKVSAYMSVHTAFTGIRGIFAPFIGYTVLAMLSPPGVGLMAALAALLSSVMFAALWRNDRFRKTS
ncbi:MAG: MFS transporter [Verrucomicrobiota bacterium]